MRLTLLLIKKSDLVGFKHICDILYLAGKDMYAKYQLEHWYNSYIKDCIVVALCVLKNEIYLVKNQEQQPVATFQLKQSDSDLCFMKLATNPKYQGCGVGTFCLQQIEEMARARKCSRVICEVYDKSEHAISFYKKKGYSVYGETDTLKYKELKMKKEL